MRSAPAGTVAWGEGPGAVGTGDITGLATTAVEMAVIGVGLAAAVSGPAALPPLVPAFAPPQATMAMRARHTNGFELVNTDPYMMPYSLRAEECQASPAARLVRGQAAMIDA